MTRNVYTYLLYLLLPFTPLKLLWRSRRQPEYLQHWRERYGFYSIKNQRPVIWLHCVSVGETRATAPLVQALCHHYPRHQILLTHTTPTGRATSEQLFGDSVLRAYLPYDLPFAVHRFLNHFKPAIGVLVETELWFNLIAACKQQQIPLLLVNARLSQKSARGYAKLGSVAQVGLQSLAAIAAQAEPDAARFANLGAGNSANLISVMGNLKFDVMPPDEALSLGQALRSQLGQNRPVLLAASTRDGEEALILTAIQAAKIPHLLTVIVPRHPQRFDEVANLLRNRIKIGVSSRGVGSLKEGKNGEQIVQDDFEIICWDVVTAPSTPDAWIFKNHDEARPYVENTKIKKPLINENLKNSLDKFLSE